MRQDRTRLMVRGLRVALLAGLYAGVGPAAAQEDDEDNRRERVGFALAAAGGYLGVGISDVDDERASELGMSRPHGVYISDVAEDGPAAAAGVEDGDVIARWNGDRLESVAQLQRLVRETPAGRVADITVLRDGAERELSVEVGSQWGRMANAPGGGGLQFIAPRLAQLDLSRIDLPRERLRDVRERTRDAVDRAMSMSGVALEMALRPRLGAGIQTLGEQLAEYFGVEGGVLVTSVSADSPAADGGLRAGDVIVGIGDEEVADPGDLRETLSELEAGEVSLRVVRDRAEQTLTVQLEARDRNFRWRRGAGAPAPA